MKNYIYLLALLLIASPIFAQTKKVFVTESGKYTGDSNKGVSYLLVQKLSGDSAYLALSYDMQNNLLSKGTYKDESLAIPDGKFTFYKTTAAGEHYTATIGYFFNGKRAGTWNEFSPDGKTAAEYTYQNGELNGPYKLYDPSVGTHGEGIAINGHLQGDFKWYDNNNRLLAESKYKNGRLKSQKDYFNKAIARVDISRYLTNNLKKYRYILRDNELTITYIVNKDGKITNPQIVRSDLDPEVNLAILASLDGVAAYQPANYDNMPIAVNLTQTIGQNSVSYITDIDKAAGGHNL